jgi:hypothetical protein
MDQLTAVHPNVAGNKFVANRVMVASWLFTMAGVYMCVAPFTLLLPSHAFDRRWPAHARFHLTWAAGKLLALGIGEILLARYPLRAGEKWSWFGLASNTLFCGGSMILASRVQHGPIAPLWRHDRSTLLGTACLVGTIVGLLLTWWPVGAGQRSQAC